VYVSAARVDDNGRAIFRIRVRDTGPGIAAEWHDSIFELFKQVDGSRTRSHGGTGLGLAISRQLAQAMGGDIRVESGPGEGSIFTVEIPYQPAEVNAAAPADLAASAAIWVTAADPLRSALLVNMVQRSGASVAVVDSADLAGQLHHADASAGRYLVIDTRVLARFADGAAMAAAMNGRRTIIVGDDGDSPDHPLRAVAEAVPFALNALLPLFPTTAPEMDSSAITRLQFTNDTPTLNPVAPSNNKRIAGVSDRGG
jgi:Histidine kinase-, DNA gyrase B-, and HSP90-like ATPase